jgi:hypothetical protein
VPDDRVTEVAGDDDNTGIELRFLESGTYRTAIFNFDGETLTAQAGGDIEAEDG